MFEELCLSTDSLFSTNVHVDVSLSTRYGFYDSLGWLAQKERSDHRMRTNGT
jgi:hypothetical protein